MPNAGDPGNTTMLELGRITYQYYSSSQNHLPYMSVELNELLERSLWGKVHIVHAGTAGDERHSYGPHMDSPPNAIDIKKVYINNVLMYNCAAGVVDKTALKVVIESRGGFTNHANQSTVHHLHVGTRPAVRG